MFPEITRDEVFRIESRHLWLRWPTVADAFDRDAGPQATPALDTAATTACYHRPGKACIAAWRAAMERGAALHLVLEEKASNRAAVGMVHLTWNHPGTLAIDYHLAPERRGEGLMSEAVEAVIDTLFLMRMAVAIVASPATSDGPGRAVLEHRGFRYLGSGMRPCAKTGGLAACDHFRLDRQAWRDGQRWAMPRQPSGLWLSGAGAATGLRHRP